MSLVDTAAPRIPLADVVVDGELRAAILETFDSGWWTMGPRVREFEAGFASMAGARHAVAVANGTAALHLALLACGIGPGDEVVLPSLNFVAAANSVRLAGATPVFCDIHGPHDLNLDPVHLESLIGPRTRAVLALHYGGFPCDIDDVLRIADRHDLTVIEDAAHAPAAELRGRKCGTFGAVGCFSFFANKNLPVGEGGMLVTGDDDLAERLRFLRSHGMTSLTWDRARGHAHTYDVVVPGLNYRLDEIRAAVGLVQLRRLEAGNTARAHLVARYRSKLAQIDGLIVPFTVVPAEVKPAHHLFVVVLPPGVDRLAVQESLRERSIQTSVHYPPIHGFSAYAGSRPALLPQTDDVAERILTLPLFPHLAEESVDGVVEALADALTTAPITVG
jgi:dTDP-4-amino-4,6-dideoxygalactose transaminase